MIDEFRDQNYVKVAERFENLSQIKGRAKFISPTEIKVNNKIFQSNKFIIATGSRPRIIPFKGLENIQYLTSREALNLTTLPETLIVIGAGAIGLEIAQMFFHFGVKVIVLEKMNQVLPLIEPEIAHELQHYLEEEGLEIHLGVNIVELKEENGMKTVESIIDGKNYSFVGNELLIATGVTANTENLGLELAGVEVNEHGFIVTDSEYRTTASHIWAAGDVIGKSFLETTAAKEGYLSAQNALENAHQTMEYSTIPRAIFTTPQVATVGLTEAEYMDRYDTCLCNTIQLAYVPKALAIKDTRGLIKMVINPENNVIVGVHMVSPMAADLIHEATLAIKFKLTINDIINTVHVFPTMSEGIKRTAQAFTRDITLMSCCII